jgi:hypothetical protein
MAESVPYNYIVATGVILPDTSGLLSDVQTEYQDVFGSDLVLDPSTPQGVLITAEALSRAAVVANNAQIANQINPNVAGGVFQDAIMALTGVQRTAQTQTQVTNVTVAGVAGTIIPQGSLAQTAAGDQFMTLSQVTIPSGGNTQVNFTSVAYGAIPCAAGALNQVVSSVLGWETVLNSASTSPASTTTLGATTQSDQVARAFRNNTLAFQGVSLAVAITSALYATTGVTSMSFRENYTNQTAVIDGITLKPNSVYACVAGGADTDVAAALLENKSSGCNWNGSTTINLVEPASGQTYPVQFDRPDQIGILVQVNTTNGNVANITQAILDYAAGLVQVTDQNGSMGTLPGFTVGASVSPFDLAAAIVAENPGTYLSNVQISLTSPISFSSNPITIMLNQQAFTQQSYIVVNVA